MFRRSKDVKKKKQNKNKPLTDRERLITDILRNY